MDYVYICRKGDNEELRYSIRSVVAHAPYKDIWLVGYKPDWYQGNFISLPDESSKFNNIVSCTRAIAETEAISDDFVLMNDDFFFLKRVDAVPVCHGGLLKNKVDKYIELGSRKYGYLLLRTYNHLIRQGIKNPLDYDIHVPMPMNKHKLRESIKKAYFPRSGYGNIHEIGGAHISDVKTYSKKSYLNSNSHNLEDSRLPFISTEDDSFQEVYDLILKDMFPYPSKYEIL
jgi:hypothetical protein